MKYIVASDYDGTLIQDGVVSTDTVNAIKKFQKQGNLFGVVTGRDYVYGYKVFKKYKQFPFDFIITHNGASACDSEGNTYFAAAVDGKQPWGKSTLAEELIKRCFELSAISSGIAFEKTRLNFHKDLPEGGEYEDRVYSPLSTLNGVEDFVLANVFCKDTDHATKVTEVLKKEFGSVLNPLQNGRCIDISAAGVDKAWGIKKLAEKLGVLTENIWTAGDNYNDIPMLKEFHGCGMLSGVDVLPEIAEYMCDSVADVIDIVLKKSK